MRNIIFWEGGKEKKTSTFVFKINKNEENNAKKKKKFFFAHLAVS